MPKKAMLITVGTGRDRKDIAHAICFSIKQHNPEFVRFLTTSKSQKETIPLVVQDPEMERRDRDFVEINKEDDVETIYEDCKKALEEIMHKRYEVSVDYTSGTKAMSAGLCLAAISKKVNSLIYITGKRDKTGRVRPGTERAFTLSPAIVYIDQKRNRFKELFNLYQFKACISIAEDVGKWPLSPRINKEWGFLERLASAYSAWDKFDLKEAFKILNEIDKSPFLMEYGLKKKLEGHKQILYKEKENNYCPERIVDLLQNAKRRVEEGKFDDAVARCYRCLEYLAQYRLYDKYKIETRELDLDRIKAPALKEKYKDVKSLGLKKAYELLNDLRDSLGRDFEKDWDSSLKKVLGMRNDSILAHGFSPIDEKGYTKVIQVAEGYVQKVVEELGKLKESITFPAI